MLGHWAERVAHGQEEAGGLKRLFTLRQANPGKSGMRQATPRQHLRCQSALPLPQDPGFHCSSVPPTKSSNDETLTSFLAPPRLAT
eukprot:364218-Chlamydomonas_euryale.AAC.21